ncbi:MAG: CehA/McbA family metallohydrolase [Oscillospiraceae bacterium]|nr:CehA/McbA family metallohydrolase [Oscillospiraceae bacterium]
MTTKLTNPKTENAQFPGLCQDAAGSAHIHWQSHRGRQDTLCVARLTEAGPTPYEEISGPGLVIHPVSLAVDNTLWYAWSEYHGGQWRILARRKIGDTWSEILVAAEGEALFYPCLFTHADQLYLLYTRQSKSESQAVLSVFDGTAFSPPEVVSLTREAYRAKACTGGDGNLYLTYDAPVDGAYQILVRVKTAAGWSREIRVDQSPTEWSARPCLLPTPTSATVCWYAFDYDAKFAIYSADLAASGGDLCASAPQTITSGLGWYMDIAAASNQTGLQAVAYAVRRECIQVRCRRGDGAWGPPARMSFEGRISATHPALLVGEDETITLAWQHAPANGHNERNAEIIVTSFTPEELAAQADPVAEQAGNPFTIPIPVKKTWATHPAQTVTDWLQRNGYADKHLLFGDIHGQSGMSDGMGEIDQYFHRARAKANLDFVSLTDHDCFPDWLSQSEWEQVRTTNRLMNKDGELSCILAFEWTPNEYRYDFGHKNVYYRGDEGELFRSNDPESRTPEGLFDSIRAYGAMCIPHHPAADWTTASAATDWDFHDPEVQRLVEIFSRHAPYEDFESTSKYTKNIKKKPDCCVQDALARGHRLGFTAGSDSHQTEHGIEGGIVAVFAEAHTRASIWDALYARASYGTTGARILLSLRANGHPMGSELTLPKGDPVQLNLSVLATAPGKVDLIKNNQIVQTWQLSDNACDAVWTDSSRTPNDYYYLRVTQNDDHMAWSSPIWVDEEAKKRL